MPDATLPVGPPDSFGTVAVDAVLEAQDRLARLRARLAAISTRLEGLATRVSNVTNVGQAAALLQQLAGVQAAIPPIQLDVATLTTAAQELPLATALNAIPASLLTRMSAVETTIGLGTPPPAGSYRARLQAYIDAVRALPPEQQPDITPYTNLLARMTMLDGGGTFRGGRLGGPRVLNNLGRPAPEATGLFAAIGYETVGSADTPLTYIPATGFWAAIEAKADALPDTSTLQVSTRADRDRLLMVARELARRASVAASNTRTVSQTWHSHQRERTGSLEPPTSTTRLRAGAGFTWRGHFGFDANPIVLPDYPFRPVPDQFFFGTPIGRLIRRQRTHDNIERLWPDGDRTLVISYDIDPGLATVDNAMPWVPPQDPIANIIGAAIALGPLAIIAGGAIAVGGAGIGVLGISGATGFATAFTIPALGGAISFVVGGTAFTITTVFAVALIAGTVLATGGIVALGITAQVLYGGADNLQFVVEFEQVYIGEFNPPYVEAALIPTVFPRIR